MSTELLAVFAALFEGRRSAYGNFIPGRNPWTTSEPLTANEYRRHFDESKWGLGVIPIREDDTCYFGAIDFDYPDLPEEQLVNLIRRAARFPLVWTRSKSGGLHAYFFASDPQLAADMRRVLRHIGLELGWPVKEGKHSKSKTPGFFEVFPKQDTVPPPKPDDESPPTGNWINLPWHGGAESQRRYGYTVAGTRTTLDEWLTLALSRLVRAEDFAVLLAASPPIPAEKAVEPKAKPGRPPKKTKPTLVMAEDLLRVLKQERVDDFDQWLHVLMAMHHAFAGTPDEATAIDLVDTWSQRATDGKYKGLEDVEARWKSFHHDDQAKAYTFGSLVMWGRDDYEAALPRGIRGHLPDVDVSEQSDAALTLPVWNAIGRHNVPTKFLYRYADALARLRETLDGDTTVQVLGPDTLAQHLARRVANFVVMTPDGLKTCYPPAALIRHLLADPAPPVELPHLTRVVRVPVFGPDGSLLTTPGYHPGSRTLYAPPSGLTLLPVPDKPSADDVRKAVALFDTHIGTTFPFAEDGGASRAHALCLLLQGFLVEAIDDVLPLFNVEAAVRRTGKGRLIECCLFPAWGRRVANTRWTLPVREEEFEKVIVTILGDGQPVVVFDNAKGKIDSAAFEKALTADVIAGRLLGSSEAVRAPNRFTWVLAANNPELSSDMAGRAVRIRLVSPVEFPEDRTDFPQVQPAYTRERVAELIWVAHVLGRAWFQAGCPAPSADTPGFGSFERWRAVLGGILHRAGVQGFLASRAIQRTQASREDRHWRAFIGAWRDLHGYRPVAIGKLVTLAEEHEVGFPERVTTEVGKATSLAMRLSRKREVRYFDRYEVRPSEQVKRSWYLDDRTAETGEGEPAEAKDEEQDY